MNYNKYLLPSGATTHRTKQDSLYTEKVLIRENPNLIDELPGEYYVYPEEFTESKFFQTKHEPESEDTGKHLRAQSSALNEEAEMRSLGSEMLGSQAMQFAPIRLRRVIGRSPNVPVINVTGIHRSHVVFAASNVVVILDYYKNRQHMLQGHKNMISCIVREPGCRYIASAATGKGSVVVIWEIETGLPHRVIHPSAYDSGISSVGFATGVENIAIIVVETKPDESVSRNEGDEPATITENILKVFYYGAPKRGEPKLKIVKYLVAFTIPKKVGLQRDVLFSPENPTYIMTTGERSVVFYTWLIEQNEIIYHRPRITKGLINKSKSFTKSIWINNDSCLTATEGGYILLWSFQKIALGLEEPANPNHNVKEYVRCFKIGDVPITSLCQHKEFFIVGDQKGNIKFFDEKFRILRWTTSLNNKPIDSVSPNLYDETPSWKAELQSMYKSEAGIQPTRGKGISTIKDYTCGGRRVKTLSQTTLERPPFIAPDLVVAYAGGGAYYYHMNEGKYDQIVQPSLPLGKIAALDTCPNTTHLAMMSPDGYIQLYDYQKHCLIFSGRIFTKKARVTFLKFHPSGSFAFIAATDGCLYFRRSYTFTPLGAPLDNCKYPIRRIIFSSCGLYMAHPDDSNCITLYHYHSRRLSWVLKGRLRSHFKPIVDLTFLHDMERNQQRLFSLGEDRRLVEYDIVSSTENKGLVVLSIAYVDQTSIPTAMTLDAPFPNRGPVIIFSNSENKIRMYDQDCHKVRRTCQGPNYGALITRLKQISPDMSSGGSARFILMVLGNKVGIMKTPIDGNPFRYMAVLGHPFKIVEAILSHSGSDVFTAAENDNCCLMWQPNIQALESCILGGGSGSKPFKLMLDANLPPGCSLVEDIENTFFHLMIKSAKSQEQLLKMPLKIKIQEIPIIMRTCGFFPSEYEIDEILEEAIFLVQLQTEEDPTEMSLDDFIILFANHRKFPISPSDITKSFEALGEYDENDEICIPKKEFVQYLTTRGEPIKEIDLPLFIPTLYLSPKIDTPTEESSHQFIFNISDDDLRSVASGESIQVEKKSDHTKFEVSAQKLSSSIKFQKPKSKIRLLNFDSKSSILTGEDEDSEMDLESEKQLPDDITASFFIEKLLTDESYKTIDWSLTGIGADLEMDELRELYAKYPDRKLWDGTKARWKKRAEWKILNLLFEKLKDENFHFVDKLKITHALLHFFRTGKFLGEESTSETKLSGELPGENEEEIGEEIGEFGEEISFDLLKPTPGPISVGSSDEYRGESFADYGSWIGEAGDSRHFTNDQESSLNSIFDNVDNDDEPQSDTEIEVILNAEDYVEEGSEAEETGPETVDISSSEKLAENSD